MFVTGQPPSLQREGFGMTETQKQQIREYREFGYGYKKIGQLAGISENTVKTFCRRNGLGGTAAAGKPAQAGDSCLCCGKLIVQAPGRKKRKFCSDKCRNKWWNAHPDEVNRKTVYNFICLCCGKPFTVYGNAHRKYCSHACYVKDRFGGGRHE